MTLCHNHSGLSFVDRVTPVWRENRSQPFPGVRFSYSERLLAGMQTQLPGSYPSPHSACSLWLFTPWTLAFFPSPFRSSKDGWLQPEPDKKRDQLGGSPKLMFRQCGTILCLWGPTVFLPHSSWPLWNLVSRYWLPQNVNNQESLGIQPCLTHTEISKANLIQSHSTQLNSTSSSPT